jgi:hypothetical protein
MSITSIIDKKLSSIQEQFPDATIGKNQDIADGINFMIYSANVIFNDFEFEKIDEGIVDSSYRSANHDYGIDAVYVTCNKSYLHSIDELDEYSADSKIVFHILQFKKGTGSDQASFLKFKEGISKCFIENAYESEVNEHLYNRFQFIHEIKDKIYDRFDPENIKISLYYVFGGIKENVLNDSLLCTQIRDTQKLLNDNCYQNTNYEIIGAQELIQFEKFGNEIVDIIHYEKTFKYITDTDDKSKRLTGYICILKGTEIAELVKKYQTALFEANIRDFYRSNDLNSNILKTSADFQEAKYFWSYNNGLTITCSKVIELPNDKYKLHGIQIVNGCQTSNALYQAYKNEMRFNELNEKDVNSLKKSEINEIENIKNLRLSNDTTILARIIETNDTNLTYRITETTNSQTPIKSFTLKANDDIQKNIQEYLLQKGIFYERRINYYKNLGKKNPVSIQHLFQLYMSMIYLKPSQVKTRPASMFNNYYEHVFPSPQRKNIDYLVYYILIKVDLAIKQKIKQIHREKLETDGYIMQLYANGRFHLGCFLLHAILKNKYNYKGIIKNPDLILSQLDNPDDSNFNNYFNTATSNFKKIAQNFAGLKKESILTALRKNELDLRIHKFIQSDKE